MIPSQGKKELIPTQEMTSSTLLLQPQPLFSLPSFRAMEDLNMLAADCLVISCCCQCLILQILVFVLLKVPYKLVRKTKEYAKKKLMHRKRGDEKIIQRGMHRCEDVFIGVQGGSGGIQVESFAISECHGYGCCMEEVEKVLEELSQKGVFAFGSFWGQTELSREFLNNVSSKTGI